MEQLVKHITSEEFSYDQCGPVASQLSEILQQQFEGKVFPSDPTPGTKTILFMCLKTFKTWGYPFQNLSKTPSESLCS
jgi:hypothetical protein